MTRSRSEVRMDCTHAVTCDEGKCTSVSNGTLKVGQLAVRGEYALRELPVTMCESGNDPSKGLAPAVINPAILKDHLQ